MARTSGLSICSLTETRPKTMRQIAQAPANSAVELRCLPMLDSLREGQTLLIVQPRLRTGSLAIDQLLRTTFVEPHNPVPNDPERDVTKAGGIGTRTSIAPLRFAPEIQCNRALGSVKRRLQREAILRVEWCATCVMCPNQSSKLSSANSTLN